jgi:hypothetical protein
LQRYFTKSPSLNRTALILDIKKDDVKAVLGRVLTWPAPAQEEAVASLHATPQELKAIDEADRSGVASEEEVEAAFRAFRMA